MQPNSCTALFDGVEDYLYIKSTDGAGFPTIKTYRIEEVSGIQQPVQDYVTRAEFEDLRKDVGAYVKQYIQELKQGQNNQQQEQLQMVMQMLQGSKMSAEQLVRQICQQRGIDLNTLLQEVNKYKF